jgi:dCMP deaminase
MRQSWTEYFMGLARLVATRSTCERRQVGAIAVTEDHRILGTGYNGALPGAPHCSEVGGCLRNRLQVPSGERQEICRAQHAEANICNSAAKYGICLDGATIYVTHRPCATCVKAMVTSGVKCVVFDDEYPDDLACQLASEVGMELISYENQLKREAEKRAAKSSQPDEKTE